MPCDGGPAPSPSRIGDPRRITANETPRLDLAVPLSGSSRRPVFTAGRLRAGSGAGRAPMGPCYHLMASGRPALAGFAALCSRAGTGPSPRWHGPPRPVPYLPPLPPANPRQPRNGSVCPAFSRPQALGPRWTPAPALARSPRLEAQEDPRREVSNRWPVSVPSPLEPSLSKPSSVSHPASFRMLLWPRHSFPRMTEA